MDESDGIPLFRHGMLCASATNSSDFVLSPLHRSSYESAGRSFPWYVHILPIFVPKFTGGKYIIVPIFLVNLALFSVNSWYILHMEIWIISFVFLIWSVGVIVLAKRRHTVITSLAEGDAIITRAAKCSMTTPNGGIEIMLGSCPICVPNISRYISKMWCFLVLLTLTISYKVSLDGECHVIAPCHTKFSMTASDGGRSPYELVGHSSPWYILDMDKRLLVMTFLVFICTAGLLTLLEHLPSINPIIGAKFSMTKEGIEIMLGSCMIRVPKSSSAHNPVLQMVRFAQYLCGVAYLYPYRMVPKYILQSRRSTSRHASEAGLVSARHKLEPSNAAISEAVPMESSDRIKAKHRSVPTESCDTTEKHCGTVKVEAMVAASSLVASAAQNSATWNHSLLSGFTPRYGMKIIVMMIIKMYVASMKNKMLAVENKYLSRTITSSEHKDEHLGAARVWSDLQTEQENTLVVTKAIPDTKPEHPSGPDTMKAEERKAVATWLIATAAPHHATGDRSLLSGFTAEDGLFVEAGDGSPMQVLGRGSVVTDAVVLPDVWFVPGLTANLVSVSKLTELDYSVGFARAACYIRCAANGAVIGKAHAGEDGMFELDFLRVPPAF